MNKRLPYLVFLVYRVMKKSVSLRPSIFLACVTLLLALGSWAQKQPTIMGATIASVEYDSASKVTTLHFVNTSQKQISAINFTLSIPLPDGTVSTANQMTIDWLRSGETTKGLLPGAGYDFNVPPRDEGRIEATVDVVVYADGTADIQNRPAYQRIMSSRKAHAVALQRVNGLISDALANAPEGQRAATILHKLETLQKDVQAAKNVPGDGTTGYGSTLTSAIQDMTNISRGALKADGGPQEMESLRNLVDRNAHEIELLTRDSELAKKVRQ